MSSNITSSAQLQSIYPMGSIVRQRWKPEYGNIKILEYSERRANSGLPLLKVQFVESGIILDGFLPDFIIGHVLGSAPEGAGASGGAGAPVSGTNARVYTARNLEALRNLGLNETATNANIKKAYRALALAHHPDKGGNAETFKSIQSAYEHLIRKGGSRRRNHRRRQRSKTRRSRR